MGRVDCIYLSSATDYHGPESALGSISFAPPDFSEFAFLVSLNLFKSFVSLIQLKYTL